MPAERPVVELVAAVHDTALREGDFEGRGDGKPVLLAHCRDYFVQDVLGVVV